MRTRPTYYLRGGKAPRIKLTIYRKHPSGRAELVEHPRLASINQLVATKTIDLARAAELAKEVVRGLQLAERPNQAPDLSEINQDIASRYWASAYPRRKITPDSRRSAKNALQRVVSSLGSVPLTAPIEAIQARLDAFPAAKQRRLASVTNSILTWLARSERVEMKWRSHPAPRHLDVAELAQLLAEIAQTHRRLAVAAAFHSGVRLGELFALNMVNGEGFAPIARQMYMDGTYGPTKTRKSRAAAINPTGFAVVKEWAAVSEGEKKKLRRLRWSDIVRDACARAFPSDSAKWLVFHDLRHCYAIEALRAGIPIEWVAKSMGNSIVVCEEYYQGFKLSDAMAKAMADIWRKNG